MNAGTFPFRLSQGVRLLAVVLAGTMLVQSGPVQLLVQQVRPAHAHHTCPRCASGVCPRTPEADCACTHSDPVEPDTNGVLLTTCDQDAADALAPVLPKWKPRGVVDAPSPRVGATEFSPLKSFLSPQRLGDEIFRPPRTTPPVRLT